MPYLNPPLIHDVFVSYAHGTKHLKKWSQQLADELKEDILGFHGEFDDLEIFIDTNLDPAMPLTDQLEDSVRASGLLLVVMSARYLESSWVKDELQWFEDEIKQCQSKEIGRAHV